MRKAKRELKRLQRLGIIPNLSKIAKDHGLTVTTFWRRAKGEVKGVGHMSGGSGCNRGKIFL